MTSPCSKRGSSRRGSSTRVRAAPVVASGRVLQLRRGLYALAPPYQKVRPHPFMVANHIVRPSYVSLQSALAYYGLIPENVPVVTSVTASRPGRRDTPLGAFAYRHINQDLFSGYRLEDVGGGQNAMVAKPEKALLDLLYLAPGSDRPSYLRELRLQNLDSLKLEELARLAEATGSPKSRRAVANVRELARMEAEEYETP